MKRTLILFGVFWAACGGGGGNGNADLTIPVDLVPPSDMATASDLATPDLAAAADMATPDMATAGDMATADMLSPPVLANPPVCAAANITADALYTNVFKPNCANGNCHATGSGGVMITSGATLKSMWVDKTFEAARVPVVKSGGGDIAVNSSYIMYKLLNQAATAGGNNTASMPKGGAKLSDPDLCQFINWIKGGAL